MMITLLTMLSYWPLPRYCMLMPSVTCISEDGKALTAGSYLDFELLGVLCLVTSARSKGKTRKYIFVERSGMARSVQNRKLIA